MTKLYEQLEPRMREMYALSGAAGLLGWDQETMMPAAGATLRAEQLSAMAGVLHSKHTDPWIGETLHTLDAQRKNLTEAQRVNVREWLREYDKATKLPEELVRELARVTSLSHQAWVAARKDSNFAAFAPWLEQVIALKRRKAEALGFTDNPYDALLDDYEPDLTVRELDPIMAELRDGLVPLVANIVGSKVKVNMAPLTKRYAEDAQEELCKMLMHAIGVPADAARLDRSAHPFCCTIGPRDVRLTTRYAEKWMPQALYGVMHEAGHALYELGFEEKYFCTPMAEAVSLGIHESQSRLWENLVGRSKPFMRYLLPRLRKRFPTPLRGVTEEQFYRAINRVQPSPIRVEADEVTYNLHIILRYELEQALINGGAKVSDLPALWNDRMRLYLDITPKNDAEGVLQDTHWGSGLVGYFPTYALGNLYAAQWWQKIVRDVPEVSKQIAKGQFGELLSWLRTNIHCHGRRYRPAELVKHVTGETLNPQYFLNYLRDKYAPLYGLK